MAAASRMIGPRIKLIAFKENQELARYSLEPGEYTIGRSSSCDLQLNVQGVSREHARLFVADDGTVALEDRASANGTFVDEWRVRGRVNVNPEQTIKLGAVTLLLQQSPAIADSNPRVSIAGGDETDLPPEFHRQDRYDIGAELAKGGMGAILSARQTTIRRTVAMKVILGKAAASPRHRLRFIEEAQITGQLEHPNIVPVHELGVDAQGQVFYTMKLVKGITLKKILDLLRKGVPATVAKYQLPALLTVFQKVCDALAFAHSKGVIHRDLKPANIMVGYFGEVLVMDWGLAKVVEERDGKERLNGGDSGRPGRGVEISRRPADYVSSARHDEGDAFATMDGALIGTPHYMSPEQATGDVEKLDARSDIFALGAILYELLTLQLPCPGGSVPEILEKIRNGCITPPHKILHPTGKGQIEVPHLPGNEVPESLSAVCMKALAHDPAHRYARVEDFQADLGAYQGGFATSAENAGTWKQLKLSARRNKPISIAAAVLAVMLAVFATKLVADRSRIVVERNRAERALADLRRTAPTFAAQALALIEQHQFEDALQNIRSARALDDKNPAYAIQEGHILQVLRRFPDALAAYRTALQLVPDSIVAMQNLAFTQRLLTESTLGADAEKRVAAMLEKELFRQNRHAEALFVTKAFARDAKRNREAWTPVLTRLGLNIDATHYFIRDDGLFCLVIDNAEFADLRPLARMPLGYLSIARTFVKDLRPLRGMPLTELDLTEIRELEDISPLRGMKLRKLELGGTHVSDLSPLRGMPLQHLAVDGGEGIADISPLAGMPLKSLSLHAKESADLAIVTNMPLTDLEIWCDGHSDLTFLRNLKLNRLGWHNRLVKDIGILAEMPLLELSLNGCQVADLSPLTGKAIHTLDLSNTAVADLSPISDLPLRSLRLDGCKNIKDVLPLTRIATLEKLVVPSRQADLSVLRKLPHLKRLSYQSDSNGEPRETVEEFWKQYEPNQPSPRR